MTYTDEKNFLKELEVESKFKIIFNTFKNKNNFNIESLPPIEDNIYNNNLSLFNPYIDTNIKIYYIESTGLYHIDLMESEVLQFNRCILPRNGRFWFEERTDKGRKSNEFILWARSILNLIKKKYIKWDDGRYVGPDILEKVKCDKIKIGPENPVPVDIQKKILGL